MDEPTSLIFRIFCFAGILYFVLGFGVSIRELLRDK